MAAAVLVMPLVGCGYSGPAERITGSPTGDAAAPKRSSEENAAEVARLLGAEARDPGMPSEAAPAGEITVDLVPGDYTVKGACAGVVRVEISIVDGGNAPMTTPYQCSSSLERLLRHPGGPVTIRSASPLAMPAAAGVAIRPNTDPRAAELEDMSEWSAQQFKPSIPGQTMASTAANHATSISMSTRPGSYELHFICDGPTGARFSMSSNGAGIVDPVGVPCNGVTFTAAVDVPAPGADVSMAPFGGADGRYAVRLVPSRSPG